MYKFLPSKNLKGIMCTHQIRVIYKSRRPTESGSLTPVNFALLQASWVCLKIGASQNLVVHRNVSYKYWPILALDSPFSDTP